MHTTKQVATQIRRSENTVRGWCAKYPDLFSDAARPSDGQERRFSDDDLDILQTLAALVDSQMTIAQAVERVRHQLAPPVIDIEPTSSKETAIVLQTPLQDSSKDIAALQRSHSALAARLQRIEDRQEHLLRTASLWGALRGAIAALAFAAFILWVIYLLS